MNQKGVKKQVVTNNMPIHKLIATGKKPSAHVKPKITR